LTELAAYSEYLFLITVYKFTNQLTTYLFTEVQW